MLVKNAAMVAYTRLKYIGFPKDLLVSPADISEEFSKMLISYVHDSMESIAELRSIHKYSKVVIAEQGYLVIGITAYLRDIADSDWEGADKGGLGSGIGTTIVHNLLGLFLGALVGADSALTGLRTQQIEIHQLFLGRVGGSGGKVKFVDIAVGAGSAHHNQRCATGGPAGVVILSKFFKISHADTGVFTPGQQIGLLITPGAVTIGVLKLLADSGGSLGSPGGGQ